MWLAVYIEGLRIEMKEKLKALSLQKMMASESFDYISPQRTANILCCQCGTPIEPNPVHLCSMCLKSTVDITEGIPKQLTVAWCRNCLRYLNPPQQWIKADLESRTLLALLLKKIKGLNKVRLVDAGFVWTEPHSRRLKVKLTVQKEIFQATVLQQIFVVEFIIVSQQCDACTRAAASNTWKAMVQIRQKVDHKRTFLYLEQLIIKHNMSHDTINIKEKKDGLDFFYASRNHAVKMLDFLQAVVVPVKTQSSEQLISSDIHSGSSNYKFTFSTEILPICKDDLVCLPLRVAHQLSQISQFVLCIHVGTSIKFIDPATLQTADLTLQIYERHPFLSLLTSSRLINFTVLDVDICEDEHSYHRSNGSNTFPSNDVDMMSVTSSMTGKTSVARGQQKYCLADITVARSADFGRNDEIFITKSHLGRVLKVGDEVLGYDLVSANLNNDDVDDYKNRHELPDVILVKKSYAQRRKKSKGRQWKLRRLPIEAEENGSGKVGKRQDKDDKKGQDYEDFLQELEEDEEMRGAIHLFKDFRVSPVKVQEVEESEKLEKTDQDIEDKSPLVQVTELLDELDLETDI